MYPYSTKHTLVSLICNYVIEMWNYVHLLKYVYPNLLSVKRNLKTHSLVYNILSVCTQALSLDSQTT